MTKRVVRWGEEILTARKRGFVIPALLAGIALTGCKVGPNYRKPVVPVPTAYHGPNDGAQEQAEAQAASFADLPWWQIFQDPVLQDLIRRCLKQNYDLQIATESITTARPQGTITRSNQLPQVSLAGYGTDERAFRGLPFKTKYATYAADATFQFA